MNVIPESAVQNLNEVPNFQFQLPSKWQGLPIKWEENYNPKPILLNAYYYMKTSIYLLGIKLNTAYAQLKGKPLPDGFFINYLVIEKDSDDTRQQILLQNRSPDYSTGTVKIFLDNLPDVESEMPKELIDTASDEILIPRVNGKLLDFIGKVEIGASRVSVEAFTWDKGVFLFKDGCGDYVITTCDLDVQSIEEHYDNEFMMI